SNAAAARGTRGAARRVVSVVSDAEYRAKITGGKLSHVGLANDDRSCRAQFLDDRGVPVWREPLEQNRAVSRWHVAGLHLILHQDRNAVQRADKSGRAGCSVQPFGFVERIFIDSLHRIELRPGLIICLNALEVVTYQVSAGDALRL